MELCFNTVLRVLVYMNLKLKFHRYSLDTDCKKWRLVADFTNDAAMCFELLLGFVWFKNYGPTILCISTGMKAIVGVAGGATRAAITQHQVGTIKLH